MILTIISAIENDAERAFIERLYRRYYNIIRKRALVLLEDQYEAEELAQDAFLRFIDRVDEVMGVEKSKLPAYIMSTVRNLSFNRLKRLGLESDLSFPAVEKVEKDTVELPEDLYLHKELIDRLERSLARLPSRERLLLEAKYTLNMDDDEIAVRFGISAQSVRTYIMRARRKAYSLMEEGSNV